MRKALLLTTFFTATPVVFCFVLIFFLFVNFHASSNASGFTALNSQRKVAFAALPTSQNLFTEEIVPAEARTEILRQFFAKYKSPLEPHAQLIVDTAEKYEMDFRLIPAIAMQESNLCTKNRPESHNCWGFGIYGDKYTYFEDYPQAIETVTKALALKYRNKHGLVTPEEIQSMYTPSSNGSWAFSVNHFMEVME